MSQIRVLKLASAAVGVLVVEQVHSTIERMVAPRRERARWRGRDRQHERRGIARHRRAKQQTVEEGNDNRVHANAHDEREHDGNR